VDIVNRFISQYRREFDFFEQAGRLVAQQLDARLQASGVRAMVTFRAKNPRRLEPKVRQRALIKAYETVEEIYADIVDLAGVRVALYFPGERKEVDKIIIDQFIFASPPKIFTGTSNPSYSKRFSGYWATHYRLKLRDSTLPDSNQRYSDARVEVQVASVLMHAWAEVEHDLVYKPLQGTLSEEELAILDELNGMVLAGEIALERLQRAAEARVKGKGSRFENHYDLASFLLQTAKPLLQNEVTEPVLGDVELLFKFIRKLEILTPDALRPYLESLNPDTERRAVAEQVVDQILMADSTRYQIYSELRTTAAINGNKDLTGFISHHQSHIESAHHAMGYFLVQWITFERFLRALGDLRGFDARGPMIPSQSILKKFDVFSPLELREIESIRRARNYLVHGVEVPDPEYVKNIGLTLEVILNRLSQDERLDVQQAAQRALDKGIK
jgi:ppGpp synthetase/RelA/SpoT-type nucleotidyltranferase